MEITLNYSIFLLYTIISCLYGMHGIKKGNIDFLTFAVAYMALGLLYQKEAQHNEEHDKEGSTMFNIISIVYLLIFLVYLKHYFYHSDADYFLFFIGVLIATVLKYNILSKKGTKELSFYENLNIGSLFAITCMFAKHTFKQEDSDYWYLALFYGGFAVSSYKLL
jgi:hypothetical protein